jgi:hypothetical protein
MVAWFHVLGQNVMGRGRVWYRKFFTSWQIGSYEAESTEGTRFLFLAELGFDLRAYSEPLHQLFLVIVFFFRIGSLDLFAWAGFEP